MTASLRHYRTSVCFNIIILCIYGEVFFSFFLKAVSLWWFGVEDYNHLWYFKLFIYRVSQKKGKRNVIIMAKRHNMCCDKRHSCTPIKTIFCLAYIITYIMTFRLPFFGSPCTYIVIHIHVHIIINTCIVFRRKMDPRQIWTFVVLLVPVVVIGVDVQYDSLEDQYVSYKQGDFPLIISAPHGGYLKPDDIPPRQDGCLVNGRCVYRHGCGTTSSDCSAVTTRDSYTREIAEALWGGVYALTGRRPHLIINELHRSRLDANRELSLATFGVPAAVQAYGNYSLFIQKARTLIGLEGDGRGLFVDIHGQTHTENWVELGYLISGRNLMKYGKSYGASSIDALQDRTCGDDVTCWWSMIRGDWSLGHFLCDSLQETSAFSAVRVVPSPQTPHPDGGSYFSGGHNTRTYGSISCGNIDAIQIEIPRSIRFGEKEQFAEILSQILVSFMNFHQYTWT